jgi:hypothetical protein
MGLFQDDPKDQQMQKFEIHMLLIIKKKNQCDNGIFFLLWRIWAKKCEKCAACQPSDQRLVWHFTFALSHDLTRESKHFNSPDGVNAIEISWTWMESNIIGVVELVNRTSVSHVKKMQ